MQRREALGRARRERVLVGLDVQPQDVEPAGRRGVQHVELRVGLEQHVEGLGLAVIERRENRREPGLVARGRQRGVGLHERAHPLGVALLDRGEQLLHAADATGPTTQRASPQTSSVTSLVNAASARNERGLPREVSAKETVPASIRAL